LAKTSTSLVRRARLIGWLVSALLALCHWLPAYADSAAARLERRTDEKSPSPNCHRKRKKTLALIKHGGPFLYEQDGNLFGNRERFLPKRRVAITGIHVPTPGA
jgi:guanyl-specific ribonuclease Sa